MANNTDWLNLSPMSGGTGQTSLSLTALTNTGLTQKFAVVTAYNERYNVQDATIVRIEGFQPTLTLSRSTLRFDSTGGTATFTVYSNTAWTIQFPSIVSSYSTSAGTGDTEVTIALGENIEQVAKIETGYVEDVYGVNRLPLTVVQEALVVFLEVEPDDDIVFDPTGSLTAITITSNADWEILANSWITPSLLTGGSGTTTVILSAGPNTEEYREGTVSVISGSKYVIMKATQDVHIDPYLTVAPTELVFSYSGENQYISVGSYPEWTAEIISTGQTHWGVDIGATAVFETDSPDTTVNLGMGGAIVNGVVVRGTTYTFPEAGRYTVQYPYTGSTAPSFQNNQHITEVSFTNLIDTLPGSVFNNCPNLTSVTIPETVTSIGSRAFKDCTALESFVFPDNVATIGAECFSGCTALTSVTLPQSLDYIENRFFYGCTSLPELAIPGSVTGLGDSLFTECSSLLSISAYGETAAVFETSYAQTFGTFAGMATGGTLYHNIGTDYSSWFQGHPSLETVHWIDYPTLLTGDIVISPSATTLDSTPQTITLLIGSKKPWSITGTSEWVSFSQTSGPSGVTSISATVLGNTWSGGVSRTASFTVTDGVFSTAFTITQTDNIYLTATYLVPSGLSISYLVNATYLTNRVNKIKLTDGTVMSKTAPYTFPASGEQDVYLVLNEGVNTIFGNCFWQNTNLVGITIPEGITEIGEAAFQGCTILSSVTMPNTLERIIQNAFRNCTSLQKIEIPDSVKNLDTLCFFNCSAATSIVLGSGVTGFSTQGIFASCVSVSSVTINEGLTSIPNGLFGGLTSLTGIVIPDSVSQMGTGVCMGCTSLSSVTLSEGLRIIPYETFRGCSSLTGIVFPDRIAEIQDGAFSGCTSLESCTLPSRLTAIPRLCFYQCSALTEIAIPNSVIEIGDAAFQECSSLSSATGGVALQSLGNASFAQCVRLSAFTLPESLSYMGAWSFSGCTSLQAAIIPNYLERIWAGSFSGCSSLTAAVIGRSVNRIDASVFASCVSLGAITSRPTSAPSIEGNTFANVGENGILYYPAGSDYSNWLSDLSQKNWTGQEI